MNLGVITVGLLRVDHLERNGEWPCRLFLHVPLFPGRIPQIKLLLAQGGQRHHAGDRFGIIVAYGTIDANCGGS